MRLSGYLMAALLCLSAAPALAQGLSGKTVDMARGLGITELRGGAMIDDVELYGPPVYIVPVPDSLSFSNLSVVNLDALFVSPDMFKWIGSPRPTLGITYDFTHESMVHASLNWHLPVANTGLFVETEFGAAVHNGALSGATKPFRNLGCRALFYWSASIGYNFDDHWSIMATEQHGSQGGICTWQNNWGLNYDGIRIGYKF